MKKRKLAAPIVISVLVGLWLLGYAVLIFLVPAIPLWICGKYNPWRGLRVAVGKPIDLDEFRQERRPDLELATKRIEEALLSLREETMAG